MADDDQPNVLEALTVVLVHLDALLLVVFPEPSAAQVQCAS